MNNIASIDPKNGDKSADECDVLICALAVDLEIDNDGDDDDEKMESGGARERRVSTEHGSCCAGAVPPSVGGVAGVNNTSLNLLISRVS